MAAIREFGKVIARKNYVLRPGGYGVVRDAAGRVGVVATSRGIFLLGGAQEGSETPRQALIREAREECGCSLQIGKRIAVADEMLFAKEEKRYFRKIRQWSVSLITPWSGFRPKRRFMASFMRATAGSSGARCMHREKG